MDFIEQIKDFSQKIENIKDSIKTEEATKTAIIMPFFKLLGYDIFDPKEFIPEFIADVGIKKREKVDYAIMSNGEPIILIECKCIGENLENHGSQLYRYFGTSKAQFGILTNGIEYKFFCDLKEPNRMDIKPFLEINILDIKESQILEVKKFSKYIFNINKIREGASILRYVNEFKSNFAEQLQNPCDDFIKFFLSKADCKKRHTQSTLESFRSILKMAINNYISEFMNEKVRSVLENEASKASKEMDSEIEKKRTKIVTTEEELKAYVVMKTLLFDVVDINDITYKDTGGYFVFLYKNKSNCWICRLYLNSKTNKYIEINDPNADKVKFPIENIYEIKKYKDQLKKIVSKFI